MIILSLALAMGHASPQQPNVGVPSQATAQTENGFYALLRQRGLSPAGLTIVARINEATGVTGRRLDSDLIAINREIATIVEAPPIDVDRLADSFARRNAIVAERQTLSTNALLETLRALTAADRPILARSVGLPSLQGNSASQAQ